MGWDRRPSKLGMRKTGSRSKTESDLVSCVLWKNWLMFDLIRNSIACSLVIIYTVLGSGKKKQTGCKQQRFNHCGGNTDTTG